MLLRVANGQPCCWLDGRRCCTCKLGFDALEGELAELLDERAQLGAADQLVFAIVQLVHGHQPVGQDALHQNTVPTGEQTHTERPGVKGQGGQSYRYSA